MRCSTFPLYAGAVLLLVLSVACEQREQSSEVREPPAKIAANLSREPSASEAAAPIELTAVLAAYEDIRSRLADDQLAHLAPAVELLQRSATDAVAKTRAEVSVHLKAAATASKAMLAVPADDAPGVRKAFGEVSRAVVALVGAEPALARGRHLFECPMAAGYRKWVQTGETISNPYMGKAMLTCGAAEPW